ncbi:MAG TPA: circadian clock protein KaiC [Candidatus Limnocylindrales bacterium]|nr:circadian clock protein KaiC [Candidatus Limnocylindrales bacterium]
MTDHARGRSVASTQAAVTGTGSTRAEASHGIGKCPTGIAGLDEVLRGGIPLGRTTLLVGGAGCGKTVFGMEFLAHGIRDRGENGVLVTFEERKPDLIANFAGMGLDLAAWERDGKLVVDHIQVDPSQIEVTGEYDLEGLFIRLGAAIDAVGARRVVLDTLEALFAGLRNDAIVRAELRRLFTWLVERGVTAMATAERGIAALTRHGLEEYVADCVLVLDNAVEEGASVRRLRVLKYRGSGHGANLYPFLIDDEGVSLFPITASKLEYEVSSERVSSGVPALDVLLGGGPFRGSSMLVSGTAGSGKSSLAAAYADAACRRGERVLYLAFEESPSQLVRNMRSIGIDLGRWRQQGRLEMVSTRPTSFGLEPHIAAIDRDVRRVAPDLVVVDPISSFLQAGTRRDAESMLARLVDMLRLRGCTALFTSLTPGGGVIEGTTTSVSSIMDTWLLLRDVEGNGERNRVLHVLKSRGSSHSNQVREFRLTDDGIVLLDVYVGQAGVLLGTARAVQESEDRIAQLARTAKAERRLRVRERRREALEARIAALRTEFAATENEAAIELAESERRDQAVELTDRQLRDRRDFTAGLASSRPEAPQRVTARP